MFELTANSKAGIICWMKTFSMKNDFSWKKFKGKTQLWINFPLFWFLARKLTGNKLELKVRREKGRFISILGKTNLFNSFKTKQREIVITNFPRKYFLSKNTLRLVHFNLHQSQFTGLQKKKFDISKCKADEKLHDWNYQAILKTNWCIFNFV